MGENKILIDMGARISKLRKSLRMTQEQLAEKISVSTQMISNVERGNKAIKIENLLKLCEILQVSTDYILTGKHTESDLDFLANKISKLTTTDYKMIELLVDYSIENKETFADYMNAQKSPGR